MNQTKNQVNNLPKETKETKILFSVNHLIKEGETAKQLKKRLDAEKRKATNDAGKDMAKAIRQSFFSLDVIRLMFKEHAKVESAIFCANLSAEIGKIITIDDVYKLPIRNYMDFVKETEATREMIRGGITPTEFKNIITRYYRGTKVDAKINEDAKVMLSNILTHNTEI